MFYVFHVVYILRIEWLIKTFIMLMIKQLSFNRIIYVDIILTDFNYKILDLLQYYSVIYSFTFLVLQMGACACLSINRANPVRGLCYCIYYRKSSQQIINNGKCNIALDTDRNPYLFIALQSRKNNVTWKVTQVLQNMNFGKIC